MFNERMIAQTSFQFSVLCFFGGVRVAHLFSFLCCVFWRCHVLLIFLVFCVVFFGGVTCCSSFQFSVLCFLVVSRVAHLFSFLCCVVLSFCVLFVFVLCLVCPLLPVSLDCPFSITPSIFSNGYVLKPGTLKQTFMRISLYCSYFIGIVVQNFGMLILIWIKMTVSIYLRI